MPEYSIYVYPAAWQEIKSLPGHIRQRVRRAIDDLLDEPLPASSRQLEYTGLNLELRRIRLDRWRIVYAVDDTESAIDVLAVRKRPPYDYGDLSEIIAQTL